MVKRKTVRQKISKREAKKQSGKDADIGTITSEEIEPGSSRMKRKLTKKLQFLSKLQETESFLATKKIISKKRRHQKKSALNSLSSLSEVLPALKESATEQPQLSRRKQAKARQQLLVTEVKQLSMVLDHPQFKENPFTAIHEHLKVTLGPAIKDPVKPQAKKKAERKSKHKKKAGAIDMEE